MADGRDRLARGHSVADEIHHRVSQPHLIGRVSAGDDDGVEIRNPSGPGRDVGGHDLTTLATELGGGSRTDNHDLSPGCVEGVEPDPSTRDPQIRFQPGLRRASP